MPERIGSTEQNLDQNLETDYRYGLFEPTTGQINSPEEREALENKYSAHIFRLMFYPNGRIVGEPLPYLLANDPRRLQFEDLNALKNHNPETVRRNLEIASAITDLMHTGTSKLREPVEVPVARVAFGTSYIFEKDKDGEDWITVRINNDPNNVFRDAANPSSGTVRILTTRTHPGGLLNKSFEEVIPAHLAKDGTILPIWPYRKSDPAYCYRDYYRKQKLLNGQKVGQDLTYFFHHADEAPPIADKRLLLGIDERYEHFETISNNSPITFEFSPDEQGSVQKQNYLMADVNPIGAFEFEKTVRLANAPDTFFDPQFGSKILAAPVRHLLDNTRTAIHDSNVFQSLEMALPGSSIGPVENVMVFDGRTGARQTGVRIDNFKISPPLWAILKSMYYQSELSKR